MTTEPFRRANRPQRGGAGHSIIPLLVALLGVATLVVLLLPNAARSDECLRDPSGVQPSCGGQLPPPPPPPPPPPGGGDDGSSSCAGVVILYADVDYRGQCWGFSAGQIEYVGNGANDRASSVWVAEGYVATLFLHSSFGGAYANTFSASDPWGWSGVGNDSVSSLVVQKSAADPDYYAGAGETTVATSKVTSPEAATAGCAKVGAAVLYKSWWGRKLWRFALVTAFCWNGSVVSQLYARELAAEIYAAPFPFSLVHNWDYTPVSFEQGEIGHASTVLRGEGKFKFCSYGHECLNTQWPWVRMVLTARGKAVCTTSARSDQFDCDRESVR